MINRIIEFSARNRMLIVILTICLTLYGVWSMRNIPLDAIPDLSDPQVIIYTEWPGRSPDLIEDQITYPIVSAMLAAPHVSTVRGSSDYGFSYVYVVFDEGTDIYWGRTRVLEYMSKISGKLPEGVAPKLGPDATGVGWAFQYALVDKTGQNNLQQLRSFNDWYLRYWLQSVPGVAEVATIGGFVKQYQVNVDPNRLLAYKVPLMQVMDAVRNGNNEVGAQESRNDRQGIPGTRTRLHPVFVRHPESRGGNRRQRYADPRTRCRARRTWPRHAARHCGIERRRRGNGRNCHCPVRPECARCDRTGKEKIGRGEVQPAARSRGGDDVRPLGSH